MSKASKKAKHQRRVEASKPRRRRAHHPQLPKDFRPNPATIAAIVFFLLLVFVDSQGEQ